MVTFTVPDSLRGVIRSNQSVCCGAMFKASSYAIKKLSPDTKYLGRDLPGFFGPDISRVEFALADELQSLKSQGPASRGLQRCCRKES